MAARRPLYVDGTDLREMSSAQITAIQQRCVYLFGGTPSVVLTRVSSSGSLNSMTIQDYKLEQHSQELIGLQLKLRLLSLAKLV